jgi:hypothetical protein
MSYLYEIKTDRKGEKFVEITGYEGRIRSLNIPDLIEEIPVKKVGANAFSGREDIRVLSLPKTLDTLGRYAFYNCKNLEEIMLFDSVEDYYDGVVKQCRSLKYIRLYQKRESYSVMKEILADYDRCLHFEVEPVGLHLTFPAYVYDFVEDVEARVLHHKITGSGYPYRECVTRKGVDLLSYDRLFYQVIADDYKAAIDIAFDRLLHPVELENAARERYEQYLELTGQAVTELLITEDRVEELIYMTEACLIKREVLDHAIELSAQQKKSEITAVLMEYQRKHFTAKTRAQTFSLEDW